MLVLAKALSKPAAILRRVAEDKPNDFCVFVGEESFCGLPNLIGDGRGLVKDPDDALAFVVEAGNCFCAQQRPCFVVATPSLAVLRIARLD